MVVLGEAEVSCERGTPEHPESQNAKQLKDAPDPGQLSRKDQIVFFRSLIRTGARCNPAMCGSDQCRSIIRFDQPCRLEDAPKPGARRPFNATWLEFWRKRDQSCTKFGPEINRVEAS